MTDIVDDWYGGYASQFRSWGFALPEATELILATYKGKQFKSKCMICNNTQWEVSGMCGPTMIICSSGHLKDARIYIC